MSPGGTRAASLPPSPDDYWFGYRHADRPSEPIGAEGPIHSRSSSCCDGLGTVTVPRRTLARERRRRLGMARLQNGDPFDRLARPPKGERPHRRVDVGPRRQSRPNLTSAVSVSSAVGHLTLRVPVVFNWPNGPVERAPWEKKSTLPMLGTLIRIMSVEIKWPTWPVEPRRKGSRDPLPLRLLGTFAEIAGCAK